MSDPTLFCAMVTAAVDALKSSPPVCAQIDRIRLRPVQAEAQEAVVVKPGRSVVNQAALANGAPVSWTTVLQVECYARSNAAAAPDVVVGTLVAAVYARLMQDSTLGGVVIGLRPHGYDPEFDADGQQAACATLFFEVLQRSAGTTLL